MPIVLAIEPDLRQAAIIKRIVRDRIHADVVVVDSRDAALDAIRTSIPDVLLLSALLSPRDEDELIAHLRLLDGAEHLQTHTIPQLAGTSEDREAGRGRGLLGMFSRKKDPEPAAASGCDPDLFAEEIRTYLQHAHQKKEERRLLAEQGIEIETPGSVAQAAAAAASAPAEAAPEADAASSSWSDPFAWRPASSKSKSAASAPAASHESIVKSPESEIASHESVLKSPEPVVASLEPVLSSAEPVVERYESVIRPEPVVTTPPPAIINREPMIAPPAARDPWAVDYGHNELVSDADPGLVGYTAPFSTPPPEPVSLVDSAVPAFQPTIDEPASPSYDQTRHVAEELDLRLEEDSAMPLVSEDLRLDAPEPVHEISARDLVIDDPEGIEEPEVSAEPEIEEEPIMAAPRRVSRSRRAAQSSLLRLMPLAIWARAEIEKHPKRGAAVGATPERSVNDELRDLMSRLAVPPNVVGVSYARGCRIRRVRVPGGRERRNGETPGPVILSKRALEQQRSRTNA
jgi:CheY-like chemotaxis protein